MQNKAILIVSFGTSHLDTLTKTISAVENDVANTFSEYKIYSAFTSGIIIKKLAQAGVNVFSPEQAFEVAINDGIKELIVQPTHIIKGDEYSKLCRVAEKYTSSFEKISIGKPLLSNNDDYTSVINIMAEYYSEHIEQGLVLMGHGSESAADMSYDKLQAMFIEQGYKNAVIGTVEGRLDISSVIDRIKQNGITKAAIAPLMLVAGDHAKNDMAGDNEQSWQVLLTKAGVKVSTELIGLGELKEIRNIYIEHIKAVL